METSEERPVVNCEHAKTNVSSDEDKESFQTHINTTLITYMYNTEISEEYDFYGS